MKTVEILAKYLPEWPLRYARIVQGCDGIFYGVHAANELAFEVIPGERLAGIMLSDDHGTSVTREEWAAESIPLSPVEKLADKPASPAMPQDFYLSFSPESEARYQAKIVCLRECLVAIVSREGSISRIGAEGIADAVSSAFDKIKL